VVIIAGRVPAHLGRRRWRRRRLTVPPAVEHPRGPGRDRRWPPGRVPRQRRHDAGAARAQSAAPRGCSSIQRSRRCCAARRAASVRAACSAATSRRRACSRACRRDVGTCCSSAPWRMIEMSAASDGSLSRGHGRGSPELALAWATCRAERRRAAGESSRLRCPTRTHAFTSQLSTRAPSGTGPLASSQATYLAATGLVASDSGHLAHAGPVGLARAGPQAVARRSGRPSPRSGWQAALHLGEYDGWFGRRMTSHRG
jgi:hypothetical protein